MKALIFLALFSCFSTFSNPVRALDCLEYPNFQIYSEDQNTSECCAWQGGVCGCNPGGSLLCCDGSTSNGCSCDRSFGEDSALPEGTECRDGKLLA